MTPYVWRLCCLSLAALFVVQICLGLLLRLGGPWVVRVADRFDASRAAALMMLLRWLPGAAGMFVAGCLCVPSYLRLEPVASEEEVGFLCAALASLAVFSYLIPLMRAAFGVARSEVRVRALVRDAEERAGLYVIRETSPAMALAGLFYSRVVVSREVAGLLTADQMDAARRHECAHRESGDNWKRVMLQAAPIDLSGSRVGSAWAKFTEWAADDQATGGDSARSVALASALVSVARLGSPGCELLGSALISDGRELRARVERLLEPGSRVPQTFSVSAVSAGAAGVVAVVMIAAQHPACAAMVHGLLEALVD